MSFAFCISYFVKIFKETGSIKNSKIELGIKKATCEANEIAILAAVHVNIHVSTRQIERKSNISRRSIL